MFRLLLVIAIATLSNLVAADFSGKWYGTMETSGSRVRLFVTLNQHDQELSGTVATGDDAKAMPIEKAEIHGDDVTFEVHDNAGRVVGLRFSLIASVLRGEVEVGGQISKVSLFNADRNVYKTGNGVSAPVVIRKVGPAYTEEARRAKFEGMVLLSAEIDPNGTATNIKVRISVGLGLDDKAIEALKQWEFKPGLKDGKPVTVAVTVEMHFRLLRK